MLFFHILNVFLEHVDFLSQDIYFLIIVVISRNHHTRSGSEFSSIIIVVDLYVLGFESWLALFLNM
jgi:hypothetical protein